VKPVNDVISEIEAAFRDVPLGRRTLHEAEVMDRYSATEADFAAARDLDRERDWRDVPDASIRECPEALVPRPTRSDHKGLARQIEV
jgi:hypothetical protein